MPRSRYLVLVVLAGVLGVSACSKFERLSIVRPAAERGKYTQVAPTYDVSDKDRKTPSMAVGQMLASATGLYQSGQFAQARQQAEQALKADPGSGDAHTLLAALDSISGDSAKAGKHYSQALALNPGNGAYANNYGTWLCKNGRAAESLAWFDKALDDPNYPTPATALANDGTCAQQAGQPMRAESSWRRILAADPLALPALSGMAALEYSRGEYMDARAFVERWLAIVPNDGDALRLAAQIEQKHGDNAAAQRYLLRLQAISPGASTVPSAQ